MSNETEDPMWTFFEREQRRMFKQWATKKICANCRFFLGPSGSGDCRKNAPVIVNNHGQRLFPITHENDWCGDYQYKETEE